MGIEHFYGLFTMYVNREEDPSTRKILEDGLS